MQQLVQNLKSGTMKVEDVPIPALKPGHILVRTWHSLISTGTEGSKVSTARKGYIGKAKEKPEQVKQVLDTLKKEGFSNTFRKVMNKLDAWAPLGYSCAGEVIAVADDVNHFRIGDKAACAGQDIANHAEVVSVPVNLSVKLPDNVSTEAASYTTVGAIALQGIRQADLRLGESCAVIGLGLIGQLTIQMLNAAGIKVFGIDLNTDSVERAKQNGAADAFERQDSVVSSAIIEASNGQGVDAVIITAGTSSLDPVEFSGQICRRKGKVIIVGAVPTGFSRDLYYKKELELRMSTSYGPGRYDPKYEEQGQDYPYGYVRWTENRNMQAFIELISSAKIDPLKLTTHRFAFTDAAKAFELIVAPSEPFVGITLEYDLKKEVEKSVVVAVAKPSKSVNIGFIGAGSFAQTFLLPTIKKNSNCRQVAVATTQGHTARTVADRYEFERAASNANEIIEDTSIDTVFITTRHDTHGAFVIDALKQGKHVFVEKPLAINETELQEIKELYQSISNGDFKVPDSKKPLIMVGFNRRFAPHIQKIKSKLKRSPVAINYRINAGSIPVEHWTQDPKTGGGRIIGELCHFMDLAMYIAGAQPKQVQAMAVPDAAGLNDTLVCNLNFANGSVASINYFANGSKSLAKEYLEVHTHGVSAIVNDFKELIWHSNSRKKETLVNQNKGHKEEVGAFLQALKQGGQVPIPFEELYYSSLLPFKVIESIQTGKSILLP
jgi:polar amino acid transport system substrate-binding protein